MAEGPEPWRWKGMAWPFAHSAVKELRSRSARQCRTPDTEGLQMIMDVRALPRKAPAGCPKGTAPKRCGLPTQGQTASCLG